MGEFITHFESHDETSVTVLCHSDYLSVCLSSLLVAIELSNFLA